MRQVQAEADAKTISATNTARLARITAESEAEALRIKGKAQADVITMDAEARARGIVAVGEAEAEILGRKGVHPNSALSILVEGQVKALAGIEKIVYCNSDTQLLLQQASTALSQAINPAAARANK